MRALLEPLGNVTISCYAIESVWFNHHVSEFLQDARWQQLQLMRHPLCKFCGERARVTAANVVDHVRLTAPPAVAKSVLAPALARFLAQYPEITIEISVEPRFTDIVAARYDAGIRPGNVIARDMIAVRVTNDMRFHVVASPDYLARRGRPLKPIDLQAHNCLRLRLPSGDFIPWEFVAEGKTVELQVEGSMVVNDPDLLVSAALEGIGVIYELEVYVQPMLANGSLVSLLGDSERPPLEGFFLYYPSRRQNPAALQALIEFFRKESRGSGRSQASQHSDSNEP